MFFPTIANVEDKPRMSARAKKQPRVLDPNAIGCDVCTLKTVWPTISTPQMKLSGNRNGDILALAEAPGEIEDKEGVALVGPSGKLLRSNIPFQHTKRIAFQNIARCRPPDNRTPTAEEMHACSGHLKDDIEHMRNLKAIIGLGAAPLRRFFPGASIMNVHGLKFPVKIGDKTVWYYPCLHPAFVLHSSRKNGDNPIEPVFRADLRRFFASVDSWSAPHVLSVSPQDVVVPANRAEAEALLAQMQDPVGIDIETNEKLRPYETGAEPITGAISDGTMTIAFAIHHPQGSTDWGLDFLIRTACTRRWVGHNTAMELTWFNYHNHTGLEIAPYEDSMAIARVANERERTLELGEVSQMFLGINVKSIMNVDAKHILSYPLSEVLPYNGLDAWASAQIWRVANHRVATGVNAETYQRILKAVRTTSEMEMMGLPVDISEALKLQDSLLSQQAHIRAEARKLYEVRQYEADRKIEFKITAPEQVGIALVTYGKLDLPRTAKDKQYSTTDDVLRPYADTNPLAKAVLEDREISKILTYVAPTLEVPTKYPDGMLHPTYTTMHVSTLRLSSRDPNIQNYPVRKHSEIRRMIAAIKDEMIRRYGIRVLFLKFDYGQLEARVLAMASKDRNLCQSIIDDFDIHSFWLQAILAEYPDYMNRLADLTGQIDEAKILKFGRDCIKSDFVFSSLYGANADSCVQRTGIPDFHVRHVLGNFWNTYRGVKKWHNERRNEYRNDGVISFLTGRKWRGILTDNLNAPINFPIQGTSADVVVDSMNEIADIARKERNPFLHPRLNLHDDLTFLVPEDDIESYVEFLHPIMTKVRFPWQCVPLTVELAIGDNWCDLHKVTTFRGEYVQ